MANNLAKLTTGAVTKMMLGEEMACPIVLQVVGSRTIASNGADSRKRYKLVVSDGALIHSFAMLSFDLNPMYESNQFSENTIIEIGRYTCSVVSRQDNSEKRVIVLFEIDVLHPGEQVGARIGTPVVKDYKTLIAEKATGPVQKENINGNSVNKAPVHSAPAHSAPVRNQFQKQEMPSTANQSMMNSSSANLNDHLTMPIDSLSPYQNKWVIKARVTSKSIIRTWSNPKGEGKLFSFDLCDETGEIRATAFRDQVDKFYDMLEVDKVYYISKCQLKAANKQYSKLRNEYEMTLSSDTVIQECTDVSQIPAIKYSFVPINDISNMQADDIIDVIAIVKESCDLVNFTSKAGREMTKREIILFDHSEACINLTIWGDEAKNFSAFEQPIILVKGAKIGEYGGGKTLGTTAGTSIKIDPDVPEGHKLRGWFDNNGLKGELKQLSTRGPMNVPAEWLNFQEAKLRNLGGGDKPEYFQVKGFIHNIRSSNAFYKACETAECNKKVVDQDNGNYRCDKCNYEGPNFKYRLLVNMLVGDWTGNRWVTVFSDAAEKLLGKTSHEIGSLLENDKEQAESIFNEISFKQMVFKLRTKVETYQDVPKSKTTVMSITEPNYKEYNKCLVASIQRLTGISQISNV